MLKKIIASLGFLFLLQSSQAQFYKSLLPSPKFNGALEKIVSDFRYNFKNISGDEVLNEGEVDTYESTVKLPGVDDCFIYRYHSGKDTTASWQGILYNGDDYKEAVKVYKNAFRMLNKSRMQIVDRSVISFAGKMQEPTDDVRFTVSTLELDIVDERYKRFKAEVELVTSYAGWVVNMNFHNKKPDTERE